MVTVTHRDGTQTALDITKIRQVINNACSGLPDCHPETLESLVKVRFKGEVSTRDIQKQLIQAAKELCEDDPDWRFVAGRLHLYNYRRDTFVNRGFSYNLSSALKYQVEAGRYNPEILNYYTEEELTHLNYFIDPSKDEAYDLAGAVKLKDRYCVTDELPQEMYMMVALHLASVEAEGKDRVSFAIQIYQALSNRKISLATPFLMNLRKIGGNLASCFILAMEDNIESIFDTVKDIARISKNGGGVGICLSKVRATGSSVNKRLNASGGVLPWVKIINDTAIAVNQGGTRAGAVTVAIDSWHLDLPDFLETQTENGDQRKKSYDIFPQIIVSDLFMRRVLAKGVWTLVDPQEVREVLNIEVAELWGKEFEHAYKHIERAVYEGQLKLVKQIPAIDLWKKILRTQVETGMPYLFFKDRVNEANPNQHEGFIPCGNLCQESWANVIPHHYAHTCNLVSLNLANVTEADLEHNSRLAVHILDNSIELTVPPIIESLNHNNRYRVIGVGTMGLADWLAKRHIKYSETEVIDSLYEDIAYFTTSESVELSKLRGCYPAYPGSTWSKGKLLGNKSLEEIAERSYDIDRWKQLKKDIKTYGIRNSQVMAIAPNTSSSLLQGCTASVIPPFKLSFFDKNGSGHVYVSVPYLKESRWFYAVNQRLPQEHIVNAISTMQFWVDTGISMEMNFNLNPGVYWPEEPERSLTAVDIHNVLISAWEKGCKSIYYIRTSQTDKSQEYCESCAN